MNLKTSAEVNGNVFAKTNTQSDVFGSLTSISRPNLHPDTMLFSDQETPRL